MLSIFPNLFTYALIAPFVLRVALGVYFIWQGIRRRKGEAMLWDILWSDTKIGSLSVGPILAKIQIVIGVLLFIGLYTQVAAILAIVFVWLEVYKRSRVNPTQFQELWTAILVNTICIATLFLGAGILAFDLPL